MARTRTKILEGILQMSASKVLIKIFSFIGFWVVVSNLSLRDFGLLNLLFALLSPAAAFTMFGLEQLVTADAAYARGQKDESYAKKLLLDYLKLAATSVTALFLAAWLLRSFLDQFYDADLTRFFWSLVLLIVSQLAMNFLSIVFESHQRFDLAAKMFSYEGVLRTLILLSLFYFGFSLTTVLWSYILAKAIVATFMVRETRGAMRIAGYAPRKDNLIFDVIRRHGKWDMIRNISNVTVDNLWPWIVNLFVGAEAVGLYAFAQKIYSTITTAVPFKTVLFPFVVGAISKSHDVAQIIVAKARKVLLIFSAFLALALIFGTPLFVPFFFKEYGGAVFLLQLMSLHLLTEVYSLGQSDVLYAFKQQRLLFFVSMVTIFVRFAMHVICVYLFGVTGMVISWLITTVVSAYLREKALQDIGFPLWNMKALLRWDDYDTIILQDIRLKLRRFMPQFRKK